LLRLLFSMSLLHIAAQALRLSWRV
jgi:hypothetical protein